MKIDLPQHPTGVHKEASLPTSPADDDRYASFAAQLAARAERLAAAASAPSSYPEEPASHFPFSLLASGRAGHVWTGFLLLLFISVSVLAVWGLTFQPSELLPSSLAEQAKAGVPSTGTPEAKVSPPVSAPPAAAALVSAPPASPRTASLPPVSPPTGAPVASPALQMPSTAQPSPAPLTPDEIRELQGRLKAAGFDPGAIDGTIGRQTRSAVREYAVARALPNADATRELLLRLKAEAPASVSSAPVSSPSVSSPPVPQQFDKPTPDSAAPLTPDEIRDLQGRLEAAGFNPGVIDGVIGRQTRSALREYAEAQGIPNAAATRDLLLRLRTEAR
ncbi:MAG TPA: peptidoglycan-binding domain-containing protein [Reyranella sp.]|nr:peptidoglycan-binding domain-containing protein [Reyranella sp.]